jgi:hypothetical protein
MTPAPFYEDGQVSLYCADLRAVDLPAGSVASVVTSPPYNVGLNYDMTPDALDWLTYGQLADDAADLIGRVLVDGGRAWLNTAVSVPAEPDPMERVPGGKCRVMLAQRWADVLADVGVVPVDQIAWCSARGAGTAWGSWESPSAPNLRGDWESILVAAKGGWERRAPAGLDDWRDTVGGWAGLCSTVWQVPPAPGPVTRRRSRSRWRGGASGCRRGRVRWCSTRSPGPGRRSWRLASSAAVRSGSSARSGTAS